jgi:hypothetical protein
VCFGVLPARRNELGLPDCVFVRSPMKPIYVDFASDMSVDLFQSMVRQASSLTVTQMYPDLAGLWLRDREGRGFVSELRLIPVDSRAHDPHAI